jgi:predicted MFS family arabinose efflux permease
MSTLAIVAFITFTTSLFVRAVDPIIPQIATGFDIPPATAALLSTAFAMPYALIQPLLGATGDMIGKFRLMSVCLAILALANLASGMAPTFEFLVAARAVAGIAAGGLLPVSLAIAGDLTPIHQRQIVIGRILAGTLTGNILGSAVAGAVSDYSGWRIVLLGAGIIGLLVAGAATLRSRGITEISPGFSLSRVIPGFRVVLRNPLAKICYCAVFLEGIFIYGLFPFVAALLMETGEARATIAGLVIAGFGMGGIAYSLFVSRLIAIFKEQGLMTLGPAMMAVGMTMVAFRPDWPVEFVAFVIMGFGFFALHACIQVYATELAPENRGSAVSLHSGFFFFGAGIGPVVYGFAFEHFGVAAMLIAAAVVINLVGLMCRAYLRRPG